MANQQDIAIHNCALLNPDFTIDYNRYITIYKGKITAIGKGECLEEAVKNIDGRGKLYMPGLIDGHTHICQTLLRGRILDELPMIWTRIMLPFESTLTPEIVRVSAQLACLEMIKSGTTAFADAGGLYMEEVGEAVLEAGLRASLTHSTIDLGNAPPSMKFTAEEAILKNNALFERYHNRGNGRIQVYYSIRSMISCSSELTRRVFDTAALNDTGVHAHMSEYPGEVLSCLEQQRMRPLEYFAEQGFLGPNFLAAHGILFSSDEIALAAKHGVKVVHCPFSNCGKGVPPTPEMLRQGVQVGLGTDGAAHGGLSIWNEMKIFRSVMNAHVGVPAANPTIMPAKAILKMATQGGAAALGKADVLGRVEVGCTADIIGIQCNQPHILPSSNLVNTLLETVTAGDVTDSIIDGVVVMQDRKVLTLDEEKVLAKAKQLHQKLFEDSPLKEWTV